MTLTHLITLDPDTGATVRVPFDLNTGAIDWPRAAPHTEPPLIASPPRKRRYTTRKVVMTCNRCGYKKLQCQRGVCHKCREGVMMHIEGKVKILVRDK